MAQVATEEVDAPGKIEANPDRLSHVALPLGGRVAAVLVHAGDDVERGQPVLLVESPEADAAMSAWVQADAAVSSARAATLKVQADYDRAKDLYQQRRGAEGSAHAEKYAGPGESLRDSAEAVRSRRERSLALLGLRHDQYGRSGGKGPHSGKVLELQLPPTNSERH